MAKPRKSVFFKMLPLVVHGEEAALYRIIGAKGGESVVNYSPRMTYPLIKKLGLDKGVDYSSLDGFLASVSRNFEANGVPFSYSMRKDGFDFHIGCQIAPVVHHAVPIRKCIIAKYFMALLYNLSRRDLKLGVPVLRDSKLTRAGSDNQVVFVIGENAGKKKKTI